MDQNALYEEDVHAWAEHQSELLRRLARTRHGLPNDLDLEHIAEEVEDVGSSRRATAKGLIRQILIHLIKLHLMPESEAVRHWRGEIVAFHIDLIDRLDPSMQGRIDLDELWSRALRETRVRLEPHEALPTSDEWSSLENHACPVGFSNLQGRELDIDAALTAIRTTR